VALLLPRTDIMREQVVSFDHTPPVLATHVTRTITLGALDCTLTTPDGRTFQGSGGYEKDVDRERSMGNE
jgi:hypothetical protein